MSRRIILHCRQTLSLTRDDIIAMCDRDRLAEIKRLDSEPMIRAYVIAADGDTTPSVITDRGRSGGVIRWTADAIIQLVESIKVGTKLFGGHTDAQTIAESTRAADRPGLAEVLGASVIRSGGRTYAVIVAYWPPQHRAQADDYPHVSIEVTVQSEDAQSSKRVSIVRRIIDVLGIALLRRDQRPAFAEARQIGVVYAEEYEYQQQPERKTRMNLKDVSFEELVRELRSRNMHIWQITTPEELLGRKMVRRDGSTVYVGGDKEFQAWAIELENRIREELTEQYKPKIEELQNKAAEAEKLQRELVKYRAFPVLQQKIASLPAGLQALINKRIDRFVPGDDPEKSADEFIAEYREIWEAAAGNPSDNQKREDKPQQKSNPAQAPALGGTDRVNRSANAYGIDIDPDLQT